MTPLLCLKRIELFGFKSFADKTEVLFDQGVTCIVGPNGCGKSNISDAIRWVLGERSPKQLRGSQMMDIIFSGTEFRKPLAYSEVHLTFDNHSRWLPIDYHEVVITRRLHRTGESEYLINKTKCRYRDIQSLVVDTGLGSGNYNMIEQGRVDYILNANPEDRRGLIEEAAGIAKYKSQKDEALRKLQHTEENLLRLKDIVLEVERNIKYAERQARRAEKFKTQMDELRKLDITHALMDTDVWQTSIEKIREEIVLLKTEISGTEVLQNEERTRLEEWERQIAEIERALREQLERRASLRGKEEHSQSQLQALSEQRREMDERTERTQEEIKQAEERLVELNQEWLRLQEASGAFGESNTEEHLRSDLVEKTEELHSVKKRFSEQSEAVSRMREQAFEAADQNLKVRNEIQRIETELYHEKERRARLSGVLERQRGEMAALSAELAKAEQENAGTEKTPQGEQVEYGERLAKRKNLDLMLEELDKLLEERQAERSELNAHLSVLKRLGEKGYLPRASVREIFDEEKSFAARFEHAVHSISTVIRPKQGFERLYRLAIGKFMDAVVVENSEVAETLIRALAEERLGEALVLLAERPNGAWHSSDGLTDHALIRGRALDFVDCAPGFEMLAESVLSGTYFSAPWKEENRSELRKLSERARLITEDGLILGPGNRIQGGFFETAETVELSVVGSSRHALLKKLHAVETEMARLKADRMGVEEESQMLDAWFKDRDEAIRKIEIRYESDLRIKSQMLQTVRRLEEEMRLAETDTNESLIRQREYEEKRTGLFEKAGVGEAKEASIKNDLQRETALLLQIEQTKEQLHAEVSRLDAELKHVEARIQMEAKSKESLKNNIELLTSLMESKREWLASGGDRKEKIERESARLQALLIELLAEAERYTQRIVELEKSIAELKERRRLGNEQVEMLHRQMGKLKDAEHEKNMQMSDALHRIETVRQQMTQLYKTDLTQLDRAMFPIPSADERQAFDEKRLKLREYVDGMGPVNLLAVEEYDELKKRYDFLTAQQNDLETSREALLEAIRKINRTTRQLFQDTFQKVQAHFEAYYRILFRGGHAELILLDESNPLESGIDIHVRPPGKKPQHISLLSGGEKALTAIALLFALFRVKPSPFCVLDEVDAPLDEANVDRFLEVLNEFLGTTQFLIITHNRKTIAKGDSLYGVTMEESGISKIVSVRVASEINEKKSAEASEPVPAEASS